MIITRTPLRISLAGGGTDFPQWFEQRGGMVVGGAINQYSYFTVRPLKPFHDFKSRAIYSRIETVNENHEIEHQLIRECVEFLHHEEGLEIFHSSDLPGRSGTGSSSTFIVGLLKALTSLRGLYWSAEKLACTAIEIERTRLREAGGWQDQIFAAYGGLNVVKFRDGFSAQPLALGKSHVQELESHLLLFYTGIQRNSHDVANTYKDVEQRVKEQWSLVRLAETALEAIYDRNWQRLGDVIDQSWRIKVNLSPKVTNKHISSLYVAARLRGAFGGKIMGSGGGGSLLLVAPEEKKSSIIEAMITMGCTHVPFQFEFSGASTIFCG